MSDPSAQTPNTPPGPWADLLREAREADDGEAWIRLQEAAQNAGDVGTHWFELTELAATRGLTDRWLEQLRNKTSSAPAAPAWLHLAFALHQLDRPAESDDAMVAHCQALPEPSSDDWMLAAIYGLLAGRWQQTLSRLDEAERLQPRASAAPFFGPWIRVHRAICLGRMGRHEEAAAQLEGLALPLPEAQEYGKVSLRALEGWLTQLQSEGRDNLVLQLVALTEGWPLSPAERRELLVATMAALLRLGRNVEIAGPAAQLRALADQAPAPAALAFFDAFAQEAQGRPAEALAQARAALATAGDDALPPAHRPLMHLVAGRSLILLDRPQDALDEMTLIDTAPLDSGVAAEVEFQRARAASNLGRHEAVLAALAAAGTQVHSSRRPLAHWLRATALAALQQAPQAHAEFVEAALLGATAADRGAAWLQAARAAEAAGLSEEAEAAAQHAIEAADAGLAERPDDTGLQMTWAGAQFLKAQALFRRRDGGATLAALQEIKDRAPDIASVLMWQVMRAESLFGQRRFDESLAAAREALDLPAMRDHPYLLNHVAEASLRLRLGTQALEARRHGAGPIPESLAEDPLAHLGQAACRVALGDLAGARAAVERTLALNPGFERNLMLRTVRMSYRLGETDHPHAEEDLALVGQLLEDPTVPPQGPAWAVLMQARGLLLNQLERWQDAEATFAELSAALPIEGAPPGIDVMSGLIRSRALLKLGRDEQARQVLETSDRAETRGILGLSMQGMARMTLALLQAADGRKDEALGSAERAQLAFEAATAKVSGAPAQAAMNNMTRASRRLQARLLRGLLERPQEALARLAPLLQSPVNDDKNTGRLEALALRAQCLADLQDWPSALAATRVLREALRAAPAPERPAALDIENDMLEAEVHLRVGSWPAAEAILMATLQQHGDAVAGRAELWWRLGRAYLGADRWGPARQVLRRAEGLLASGSGAAWRKIRADVASRLAVVLLRSAEPEPALATLEAAEKHDPLTGTMLFNRAVALLDLYRREPREECLDKARSALEAARRAGQPDAAALARQIAKRDAQQGAWFGYWFGADAPTDRHLMGGLLILATGGLVVLPLALAIWRGTAPDWTALAPPAAVGVALLLLPGMRSLSLSWGDAKFSAEPATGSAVSTASIPATLAVVDAGELVQVGIDRMFDDFEPGLFANLSDAAIEWASGLHEADPQTAFPGAAAPSYGKPTLP